MSRPRPPISDSLPPLIFGTATFNYQYNVDPFALGPSSLVGKALEQGVNAFDTSPYYGPAEEILGAALDSDYVHQNHPRSQYFILTKVGRIAGNEFDYSPAWIRKSVRRSCERLKTTYLDVVYCHDCEFVSPKEVLDAVRELRRIRNEENTIKYVGISGYPIPVLCELSEMILCETGEPFDIVQSYANFTLQNTRLLSEGLRRFVAAGVNVVTNASPLGMGLLRSVGPPLGAMGNWHPAPDGLRQICADAARWTESKGKKLEVIAVRYALEQWLRKGAEVGTSVRPRNEAGTSQTVLPQQRIGVSVMGVSKIEELDETMRVWRSVLADRSSADTSTTMQELAKGIREIIGDQWIDHAWASPDVGFIEEKKMALL